MNYLNNFFSLDPYRLVVINSIVFVWFCCILVILIYRKKRINPLIFIACLSLLPLLSILRAGTYESGDLTFQAYKLLGFYNNLKDGILIPRWASELNGTYGYPNYIFSYQLPYYIGSLFHALGLSFINSVKATLMISYILSGVFFYSWIRKHVTIIPAMVGAILYLFAPYRFVNLHFRATMGENIALMILPLTAYCAYLFTHKRGFRYEVFLSTSLAALILSHQAVAMITLPWLLAYVLFLLFQKRDNLFKIVRPFSVAFLLTAYYWIPLVIEGKFTLQAHQNIQVLYETFQNFFISPWRLGFLFQGPYGELSPALGYVHWAFIITSCVLLYKRKAQPVLIFFIVTFVSFFIAAQEFSPTWYLFPFLHRMQFAYRYLTLLIFLASAIAALSIQQRIPLTKAKYYILTGMIIFAVASTILNWGNRKAVPSMNKVEFENYAPFITAKGEGLDPAIPMWANSQEPWKTHPPERHLESLGKPISYISEIRSTEDHRYVVIAKETTLLQENTAYFPGWEVYVDGEKQQDVRFQDVLRFSVPSGMHVIRVSFEPTLVRQISLYASAFTLLLLSLESLRRYYRKLK